MALTTKPPCTAIHQRRGRLPVKKELDKGRGETTSNAPPLISAPAATSWARF